jgi:hypothetical protein
MSACACLMNDYRSSWHSLARSIYGNCSPLFGRPSGCNSFPRELCLWLTVPRLSAAAVLVSVAYRTLSPSSTMLIQLTGNSIKPGSQLARTRNIIPERYRAQNLPDKLPRNGRAKPDNAVRRHLKIAVRERSRHEPAESDFGNCCTMQLKQVIGTRRPPRFPRGVRAGSPGRGRHPFEAGMA